MKKGGVTGTQEEEEECGSQTSRGARSEDVDMAGCPSAVRAAKHAR